MKDLGNKQAMSENLKRLMDERNVSPKELGKALGFPYTTVLSWLKADNYPRIDKIELIAAYFGVIKSDLIEYKTTEQREVESLDKELTQLLTSLSLSEKRRVLDFIAGIKSSRK